MPGLGKGSFVPTWAGFAGRLTAKLLPALLAAGFVLHVAAKNGPSREAAAAEVVGLSEGLLG